MSLKSSLEFAVDDRRASLLAAFKPSSIVMFGASENPNKIGEDRSNFSDNVVFPAS
ncbi:MAG: hypothetical protein RL585_957 [Pseudomonadota bacterium]